MLKMLYSSGIATVKDLKRLIREFPVEQIRNAHSTLTNGGVPKNYGIVAALSSLAVAGPRLPIEEAVRMSIAYNDTWERVRESLTIDNRW